MGFVGTHSTWRNLPYSIGLPAYNLKGEKICSTPMDLNTVVKKK